MVHAGLALLIEKLSEHAKASHPINPRLLTKIPYFTRIFPYEELWSVLVKLSGDDGIAHFEKKRYEPGEKLISKGCFDQMIYWVLTGNAHVVTTIRNQPKVIHKSNPGECIGALGVLRGAVRNADVVSGENGVEVLELDWAITEKNPILSMNLYHLIALNLADELDGAYNMQLNIIANSIHILQDKTSQLIEKNRRLRRMLEEKGVDIEEELETDQAQALGIAIANIKESLSLLEMQVDLHNLNLLGTS